MKKNNNRASVKYVASVSGGKDSVCMVLKLIQAGWPLHCVLFVDLGMEFKATYLAIEHVKAVCEANKIPFYVKRPKIPFMSLMLEKRVEKRDGTVQNGYYWCGGVCRWATTIKFSLIEEFYKEVYPHEAVCEYVGIAYDEQERIQRKHKKMYPLIEWQMKEADCLEYCYQNGIGWEENSLRLYDYFDRLSCWCCGNKNLKELRNMWKFFPDYWEKLKELQRNIPMPFYHNQLFIFELEMRFIYEDVQCDFFHDAQWRLF